MSSVGVSSKRPGTAFAAAAAAKQRRQRVIAAVLGVVLIAVLAYEVPQLLKLIRGSKSAPAPAAPVAAPATLTPSTAKLLKALLRTPAGDPFSQPSSGIGDPSVRAVSVPAGSVDPFAAPTASVSSTQPSAPPVAPSPLPEQIVIGTPGGSRVPTHGWIVILASIPTGEGITSATSFATKARGSGISPVSVLNSSNRRPLRGGYWVVYTGPYATLGDVTNRAGAVHSLGYPTAYIRELIVYR